MTKTKKQSKTAKKQTKPKKPVASATLLAYQRAVARRDRAQSAYDRATRNVEVTGNNHRRKHPLSEKTRARILASFVAGNPLCCTRGRENLAGLGLDGYWIEYLNDWAYEALGCSDEWKLGSHFFEHGSKRLREKLAHLACECEKDEEEK